MEKKGEKMEGLQNIYLDLVVIDSNFGNGYALSERIPRSEWDKIKEYMRYYRERDATNFMDNNYTGWVTFKPERVEEALDIKEELRVATREKAHQERHNKYLEEVKEEEEYIEKKYPRPLRHFDWSFDDYRFYTGETIEELKHHVVQKYYAERGTMKDGYFEKREVKEFLKNYPDEEGLLIGVVVKKKR